MRPFFKYEEILTRTYVLCNKKLRLSYLFIMHIKNGRFLSLRKNHAEIHKIKKRQIVYFVYYVN